MQENDDEGHFGAENSCLFTVVLYIAPINLSS